MKHVIIYVALSLCLFVSKAFAQETFEDRAKIIADKIEQITKEEKSTLKAEVDDINKKLDAGTISTEQSDEQKLKFAQIHADNIERRTAAAQEELKNLIQDKVDGRIKFGDTIKRYRLTANQHGVKLEDLSKKKDSIKDHAEARTTSQGVFAVGFNNLLTDGALAHSDYKIWGSYAIEWGTSWNTRILKNSNLMHAKYGFSVQYNNLRATDNRLLTENGDQTDLVTSDIHLKDSRFKNVNLVLPIYLEFDFAGNDTKDGKRNFRIEQGFRLGIGGFVGGNLKSKQIIKYENDQNNTVRDRTRGDFNVNDFVYGLGAYIGYKETSLYVKYDLQPVFEDNAIDQNNISFGIRFDVM
jgi:hypothetical protein